MRLKNVVFGLLGTEYELVCSSRDACEPTYEIVNA
jgi:hypothetical protein